EAVSQGAVRVNCTPHQALHHARDPHCYDIKNRTNCC
ncbi:hypothetical protein D030_1690B, partial [Vibrio parahaemolyticus AQ3810]